MLEAVDELISVWGPDSVGLHLAPKGDSHDSGDSDLAETFGYVARAMKTSGIAFLFTRESQDEPRYFPKLKEQFGGVVITNQQLDQATAEKIILNGEADAASWGQLFIANPDLACRFAEGLPLTTPQPETFYGSGPEVYTDHPFAD